jgi:hypothetical protein
LYCYGQKAIARITASHAKDGTVNYSGEAYVRTSDLLGKDINLVAGGKWARIDLPGQKAQDIFEVLLGAQLGPLTVEYYGDFGKGMKPVHMVYVGTSANDLCKFFAKDKKK